MCYLYARVVIWLGLFEIKDKRSSLWIILSVRQTKNSNTPLHTTSCDHGQCLDSRNHEKQTIGNLQQNSKPQFPSQPIVNLLNKQDKQLAVPFNQ